jgi:hypothetical protein
LASKALLLILSSMALRVTLCSDQRSTERASSRSDRDTGSSISGLIANDGANSCAERGTSDRSRYSVVNAVLLFAASGK